MNVTSYNCCSTETSEGKKVNSLVSILKVVTEPNRLRILCILKKGEHCVCEILEHVDMSQSLVSHHLRDLKESGLVVDDKRGLKVYYSLTDRGSHITKLLFKIT